MRNMTFQAIRLPRLTSLIADPTWRQPREMQFTLAAGAVWGSSSRPRAILIACVAGDVWITQAGDARDVTLSAGHAIICAAGRKLVVQALSQARIEIHDPAPSVND